MPMKKDIFTDYKIKNLCKRTEIILCNFTRFPYIIASERESLKYWIIEDRRYGRSHQKEELGVSVHGTGASDITAREALERIEVSQWVESRGITDEMLKSIQSEELIEKLDTINLMESDYRIFCRIYKGLPQGDQKILNLRIVDDKTLEEISEIYCIEPESVKKRLQRIRKNIREEMERLVVR